MATNPKCREGGSMGMIIDARRGREQQFANRAFGLGQGAHSPLAPFRPRREDTAPAYPSEPPDPCPLDSFRFLGYGTAPSRPSGWIYRDGVPQTLPAPLLPQLRGTARLAQLSWARRGPAGCLCGP